MKTFLESIASAINRVLDVPSPDPDDARRRKLLNILLLFLLAGTFVSALVTTIALVTGSIPPVPTLRLAGIEIPGFLTGIPVAIVASALLYAINRYWSGTAASTVFLLIVVASLFTNAPDRILSSHLILTFAIPVVAASFLLRPYASFIAAALIGLLVAIIGAALPGGSPMAAPLLTLEFVALVSWLAALSMERALKNLRALNLELDQRVQARTRELAESLSKTEAILNSTADGIVVFDDDGRATIANLSTEHLLGQPPREIVGRDIDGLMRESVSTYDQEVIEDIIKDATAHYPSLKVKWDDKTLSMSAAPVKLDSGEDIGTVAVFRDFTQEAEVDRMKSTFLSIASHDLRSPLGAILGLTELVREGVYVSLEEQRHAIDRIYSNTQYMLSLANSLLGQAQIEAGILELRPAPFSPANLIKGVVSAMDVLAHDKGIELVALIADDIPDIIVGDQEKLSQVLFNLVGNGIKFTNEGAVQVRAYRADEADHTGQWALEVSDTGRGIPEETLPIIFEPFLRADASSIPGVGLGLSIARQLVELMGGEIRLESQVGEGSTFTVVLPLEQR
jgi:PAS domain S-box-containing protein